MGWTPQQVEGATRWQFGFAVEGWMQANGGTPKTQSLSEEEHDRLMEKYA